MPKLKPMSVAAGAAALFASAAAFLAAAAASRSAFLAACFSSAAAFLASLSAAFWAAASDLLTFGAAGVDSMY